jgi:protein transport protein SEC24
LYDEGALFQGYVYTLPTYFPILFYLSTNSYELPSPSTGLQIEKYYGNFHFQNQSSPELAFGILDSDKAISVSLSHTQKLDPRGYAYLQNAVLYTTAKGERRVRVCNLALNVVEMAGNVFQFAEFETTVCHMTREGDILIDVDDSWS